MRPRFFARQNAAGILRRWKRVVGDGDARPDTNSEQLEGWSCVGGQLENIRPPNASASFLPPAELWEFGEGPTEALRGPLIGRRSAL